MKESKMFKAGFGRACGAVVLAGALAMPATAFAAAGFPDDDVAPGSWYASYVQAAVEAGIVRGYPDGTFRPEQGVTRAQVAEMLCRVEGAALPEGQTAQKNTTPWSDNPAGMWYTNAMNWAHENGVFTGDGAGTSTVRPDDGITREEMAKVVASYMVKFRGATVDAEGLEWPGGADKTHGVEDVSDWALPYFLWLCNQGVMGGYDNGDGTVSLDSKGAATRAMFSKVAVTSASWAPSDKPDQEQQQAAAPAKVEAYDVTKEGASFRAFDAKGVDITSKCEFSLGGAWQSSATFRGLAANTAYKVKARVAAAGDVAASDAVSVSFRTATADGQESGQQGQQEQKAEAPEKIWVKDIGTDFVTLSASAPGYVDITDKCEFSIGGEWQSSPTFTGLEENTMYEAKARVAASGDVAASDPVSRTIRTRAEETGAVAPAKVEAYDITKNSVKLRAFNAKGKDVTSTCQFLVNGRWQDSCELKNLAAGTEYTIDVRRLWGNGLEISDPVTVTFRTLESSDPVVPASARILHSSPTIVQVQVLDAEGTDISQRCEYSVDHRAWHESEDLRGLMPDTEYTVDVRARAVGDGPAGDVLVSVPFRTDPPREGMQIMRAEKPERVEIVKVHQDCVDLQAFNADGVNITAKCEFRTSDGLWQCDPAMYPGDTMRMYGLTPGVEYTVYARGQYSSDLHDENGNIIEVFPSDPAEASFTTLYGAASAEAFEVGSDYAKLRAFDVNGNDITDKCLYALEGPGVLPPDMLARKDSVVTGLRPDTRYLVKVHMPSGGGSDDWIGVNCVYVWFNTAPAQEV